MRHSHFLTIAVCLSLLSGAGCERKEPTTLSDNQTSETKVSVESFGSQRAASVAEEKFLEICRAECGHPVVSKMTGQTFWIYVPADTTLFDFKASPRLPPGFAKTPRNFSVEFLEGSFADGVMTIEYDIVTVSKAPEDAGYSTSYTEEYSKIQNNISSVIARAFFDLDKTEAPHLIVMTVTDIQRGIETISTFALEDFKRYISQSLPYDEYAKRHLSETRGDAKAVGDKRGRHINFRDIPFAEFLTDQTVNRIRFKYQRSDFAPEGTVEDEILRSVAETMRAYQFQSFNGIKLIDLRKKNELYFDKSALDRFKDTNQGSFRKITFF